jgi:hypothetical protein
MKSMNLIENKDKNKKSKIKKAFKKIGECTLIAATAFTLSCGGIETNESNSSGNEKYTEYTWEGVTIEDKIDQDKYDSLNEKQKKLYEELSEYCKSTPLTLTGSTDVKKNTEIIKLVHSSSITSLFINGKKENLHSKFTYDLDWAFKCSFSLNYHGTYDSLYYKTRCSDGHGQVRNHLSGLTDIKELGGFIWAAHLYDDDPSHFNYITYQSSINSAKQYLYICATGYETGTSKREIFNEILVIPRADFYKMVQEIGLTDSEVLSPMNY